MAAAGLGDDLLLANETVEPHRLRAMADCDARVTVAVDSAETVDGPRRRQGSARCSSTWTSVSPLRAASGGRRPNRGPRAAWGMSVRGVMGYEGHCRRQPPTARGAPRRPSSAWRCSRAAHDAVGGDVISAGGTGTYDINVWCTEIQAGSYALMDTAYASSTLPFRRALWIEATVISRLAKGWAVADCGLKSLGMDHGDPTVDAGEVLFCSDEHVTIRPGAGRRPRVGDRVQRLARAHRPDDRLHERMQVTDGDDVVEPGKSTSGGGDGAPWLPALEP